MKKEDISLIAQLLASIKDSVEELETAYNKKDAEHLASAKKEILEFQSSIEKLL